MAVCGVLCVVRFNSRRSKAKQELDRAIEPLVQHAQQIAAQHRVPLAHVADRLATLHGSGRDKSGESGAGPALLLANGLPAMPPITSDDPRAMVAIATPGAPAGQAGANAVFAPAAAGTTTALLRPPPRKKRRLKNGEIDRKFNFLERGKFWTLDFSTAGSTSASTAASTTVSSGAPNATSTVRVCMGAPAHACTSGSTLSVVAVW